VNLIIVTSDELRADTCGFMGNPDCKTPNLDAFAERGVAFENHYTVHGKCVPSRVAMMTGRYAHTDGFRTVNTTNLLKAGDPNLLHPLKAAGYETAYFGHNHVWEEMWGTNEKSSGCVDYQAFTTGWFDHLVGRDWPVEQPGPDATPIRFSDKTVNLRVGRRTEPLSYFCDDNRTEQAIHYLRNVRDRSRPFYMQLNIGNPHPPYAVEEPYFSMYDRAAIQPFEYGLPENAPLHLRKQREVRSGPHACEEDFRQVQAVYYGSVTKVDLLVGRLMAAIEEEGLFDTLILFTSDHGDFAGQYGLPEKWDTAMQDCILRTPMILSAPGLPKGQRVDALTEHVDLAPTILESLGLKADWTIHGESLLPVIAGDRRKDAVFADGGHEAEMRGRFGFRGLDDQGYPSTLGKQATYHQFPDTMAQTRMVRTEKWKLVIREIDDHELYDMENDPNEMCNLWGRPRTDRIVEELMLKLLQWSIRTAAEGRYQEKVGA